MLTYGERHVHAAANSYKACEALRSLLIYAVVIFGPWAFGTTQPWAVWLMNGLGYTLGILWCITALMRHSSGYLPLRASPPSPGVNARRGPLLVAALCCRTHVMARHCTIALGFTTIAILGYCLISAVNARAIYFPGATSSEYRDCIRWLPHSFDSRSTWMAFWTYLALACFFWATRTWLLTKSPHEELASWRTPDAAQTHGRLSPARLRNLLWALSINGGLLALEGILQRLTNSPKLLFLIKPQIHQTALGQFGPFAYRANAAEYFNLLWPACLGFWWSLGRAPEGRKAKRHWLLLCALFMAICPTLSTSRGGAIVSAGLMILTGAVLIAHPLLASHSMPQVQHKPSFPWWGLPLFFLGAPALALALGWGTLRPRLETLPADFKGRQQIYHAARRIADDFPVFGTGPGTYESVSELYRPNRPDFWPAQVHNDWLETRITFGWVGSALLAIAFALLAVAGFIGGGLHIGRSLLVMTWLGLLGCLVHAQFDFPFQIHSILCLFLTLSAIVSILSWHAGSNP